MAEDLYSLDAVEPLADAGGLTYPRAQHLADAIGRHRDFKLVGLGRWSWTNGELVECLFVEVTCDRVPKNNPYDLRYRERLAVLVRAKREDLPMVLALRKDFPRLVHMNRVAPGTPAHLCLYFEPVAAILRTWTPETFLHRIVWWIEQSARGELHLADQPLDHLFFSSKFELVLPWNYDSLREGSSEFIIARSEARPDGGITCFLLPRDSMPGRKMRSALLVDVALPAVVNDSVELAPSTLGQLAALLEARGIALLPALQLQLQALAGKMGATVGDDQALTVILVRVPICREAGVEPESTSHRAFVLRDHPLELGVATGALVHLEGRYYSDSAREVLGGAPATAWRELQVTPVDVLFANTPEKARQQSGVAEPGPVGAVVGTGSLGSALLNLWGRSGWGRWTVIDKDHVKPHNLSRHTAIAEQIGDPKVHAVAAQQSAVMQGACDLVPIVGDACDAANTAVRSALTEAALVVDASADLEYPRYASTVDTFARHASVFVTPNGNAGVALIEDASRAQRLRTLEAQYYRAVIDGTWGRDHLAGHLGAFWSGASCRDISMVLPYARVMGHASTFAEHLPALIASSGATIRIWQRDPEDGAVVVHDVQAETERSYPLGELTVFLDAGVERNLHEMRSHGLPNETGGVLLGYYDYNIKALIVVAALPAPPDSRSTPGSFERGVEGLKEAVDEGTRRTGGIVGYIGEWHSHPRGHSAVPSRDDWIQLIHLALGMGDDGLPGVQLIVGEDDLHIWKGELRA